MASRFRTVVLIDAKPLILWRCIYACSASSAVTHPVVSCSAEASGIPRSMRSWSFRVKVLRYLRRATSVYALAIIQDFSIVFLGQRVGALPLAPKVSCTQQEITLPVWTLYNSRLLLMCVLRLAPARQPSCSFTPVELLFPESPFLFHCPLLLLWNAPFLTKEPAGGLCLNEPAASGNRGFSSPGLLVGAAGGHCQLVALRVALCVGILWLLFWKCSKGEKGGMR